LPPMSRLAFLVQHLDPTAAACVAAPPRPAFDASLLRIFLGESPPETLVWNGRREARALAKLSGTKQLDKIRHTRSPRRSTATLAALLAEVRSTVHASPTAAGELAELAVTVAVEGAAAATPGALTLALAYRANALRADARLREAEPFFARAAQLPSRQDKPRWVTAEFSSLLGSWLKDARHLDAAEMHLEAAVSGFVDAGDEAAAARALIKLAERHWLAAEPEGAVAAVVQALRRLHPVADERLWLFGHHNLALYLSELGEGQAASLLFRALQPAYARFDDQQTTMRRLWLEASIARSCHDHRRAEQALRLAIERTASSSAPFLTAFVALDLATLLFDQGRVGEVLHIAASLPPLFEEQGIHSEALAAVALFHRAAAQQRLTASLLAELRDFLQRSQVDREARFRT